MVCMLVICIMIGEEDHCKRGTEPSNSVQIEMEAHAVAMQQNYDGATLTPKHIVDAFQRAYRQVYGREAQVVHMFAEWYTVNGETVHRMTLFTEIARLSEIARLQAAQRKPPPDRTMVQRLIARLRGA